MGERTVPNDAPTSIRPPLRLTSEMLAAIGAIVEPKRKRLFPWPGSREEFARECSDVIDGAFPDE